MTDSQEKNIPELKEAIETPKIVLKVNRPDDTTKSIEYCLFYYNNRINGVHRNITKC